MSFRPMFRGIQRHGMVTLLLAYILACSLFGGASRYWLEVHAILQVTAATGIALLILSWPSETRLTRLKVPIGLLSSVLVLTTLQIVPLPSSIWTLLPGRELILEGYDSLGVEPGALPISLDLEASLQSIGYALTPLFVILLAVRTGASSLLRVVPVFLCGLGVISVLIGLSQVYAGQDLTLYFYDNTNFGFPVGAFANVNHFGSLLLMIFPFAIVLFQQAPKRRSDIGAQVSMMATALAVLLFLCIGIVAAGSLAVYLMFVPVLIASLMSPQKGTKWGGGNRLLMAVLMGVILLVLIIVLSSPVLDGLGVTGASDNPTSRQNMWLFTLNAIDTYWPLGTGAGTYESVIPQFEDQDTVSTRYIALAHNEFLQILVEFGVLGACLVIAGVIWFANLVRTIMFKKCVDSNHAFQRAAVMGMVVCLCHSFVDYPARTPAIASILAVYVAIASLPLRPMTSLDHRKLQDPKRLVL
mgnify:CR=1 FL=1